MELHHFSAPLRGARSPLAAFPGRRYACPGLLSLPPSGRHNVHLWTPLDSASKAAQNDSLYFVVNFRDRKLGGFGLEEVEGLGEDVVDFVGWGVFIVIVGG